MSEEKVQDQDVKTDSVQPDEKTAAVSGNEKSEDYQVPGYRFRELNEKNKILESELNEMKAQAKKREEAEAEEKQEYRELYEKTKVERDSFAKDAERFYSIEQSRKDRLLESFPENLREKINSLDSDTLEEMKNEFETKVPRTDQSDGGVSGGKAMEWSKLPPSERKKHFADIMRGSK